MDPSSESNWPKIFLIYAIGVLAAMSVSQAVPVVGMIAREVHPTDPSQLGLIISLPSLVVAIGAPAFRVAAQDALGKVFGYTCGLDLTRRDLQFAARDQRRPWDLGKDFESAAVLSPIVRVAECGHLDHGKIELSVNGMVKQSSDLKLLIHPVPALIADLSKFYHLQPGDLIYTVTPE